MAACGVAKWVLGTGGGAGAVVGAGFGGAGAVVGAGFGGAGAEGGDVVGGGVAGARIVAVGAGGTALVGADVVGVVSRLPQPAAASTSAMPAAAKDRRWGAGSVMIFIGSPGWTGSGAARTGRLS